MKSAIIITLILISSFYSAKNDEIWNMQKQVHGKSQETESEESLRHEIFSNNINNMMKHNLLYDTNQKTYRLSINQFSDLTQDEFKEKYLTNYLPQRENQHRASLRKSLTSLPDTIDWNKAGALTPIKNQGQCGSCWAFSAIETTESAWQLKTKQLKSLSVQQLVDCDVNNHDNACRGGMYDRAWDYMKQSGCVMSEEEYPYISGSTKIASTCQFQASKCVLQLNDLGYTQVEAHSSESLKEAVANRPTSVAVYANSKWQHYGGGVLSLTDCPASQINHAVQATGYGVDDTVGEYWTIRNSWGPTWGESGFIRIARGTNVNTCNVLLQPAYTQFKGDTPLPSSTTCKNYCGKQNTEENCDCSTNCDVDNSKCCTDYKDICYVPTPIEKTCLGHCGYYNYHAKCDCTTQCKLHNNCCIDYNDKCDNPVPPKPSTDQLSCSGLKQQVDLGITDCLMFNECKSNNIDGKGTSVDLLNASVCGKLEGTSTDAKAVTYLTCIDMSDNFSQNCYQFKECTSSDGKVKLGGEFVYVCKDTTKQYF